MSHGGHGPIGDERPKGYEKHSPRAQLAMKIDLIKAKLKAKGEVMSGFGDLAQQARKLELYLKGFAQGDERIITYTQFFNAMTKLNFVGCAREVEAFFDLYDEYMSGKLDYRELVKEVYGLKTDTPKFERGALLVLEKMRERVQHIAGGMSSLTGVLSRYSTLDRIELEMGLSDFGFSSISSQEFQLLFDAFDPKHIGPVPVAALLRALLDGSMFYERKLMVQEVWRRFDDSSDKSGRVPVRDLLSAYDASTHPLVVAGKLSQMVAEDQFLACFAQGGDAQGTGSWPEFLDYHKGISLAIDSDAAFDLMLRNGWQTNAETLSRVLSASVSFSSLPVTRRVLVTHSDGKQEVVELVDDSSLGRLDVKSAQQRVRNEKGVDDIASLKL